MPSNEFNGGPVLTGAPVAAAAGYPVPPVVIVAGVTAIIPVPAQQAGPVPVVLAWCVLQNNSPFTLLVSQGQVLTQIAPFTMDRVQVNNPDGQTGITVLGQVGNGPVSPLADSVVNATWYADPPAGAYPAALGSGSVILTGQSVLVPFVVPVPGLQNFGPFDTSGFGGVSVLCTSGDFTQLTLEWLDANANIIARRSVTASTSASASFQCPVAGPFLRVTLNQTGAVGRLTVQGIVGTVTARWFDTDFADGVHGEGVLLEGSNVFAGAGTVVLDTASYVFAGPASWWIDNAAVANWNTAIRYEQSSGVWVDLFRVSQATFAGRFGFVNVTLPARPVRVEYTATAAGTVVARVVADQTRV